MGRSRDMAASTATNETRFVNTSGDTMTGDLGIGGTATDANWNTAAYGNREVSIDGGGGYGVLHFRGDGAGSTNTRFSMGVGDQKFYMAYDDVAGAHRMEIDNAGRVTMPGQVSFKAHGQDNAYITTSPLGFPSLSGRGAHNIGNHYNTANSTFTAPVAGRYLFHVHVGIVRMTSTGGYIYPNLEVNSASIMYTYNNQSFSNSGSWNQYANSHMTQIVSLAANDVVRVTVQWGSADYYNGPGELSFAGCLLG